MFDQIHNLVADLWQTHLTLPQDNQSQNYQKESTMSKEFKAGDPVYFPAKGTQVFQLEGYSGLYYPLAITFYDDDGDKGLVTFTLEGFLSKTHKAPLLFHATPEMKAKLEALYGVEFETPPSKPTSREIIKAKLNKSTEPVPCWVSNVPDFTQPNRTDVWAFIKEVDDGQFSKFPYLDATGNYWMHATPFDPRAVEAITELPKGEN